MNSKSSTNETKINGFVTDWDENTQLVYSADTGIPLKDNQMNLEYSTHTVEGFQKLMYWLIVNLEHRVTLFIADDSSERRVIYSIMHSFYSALELYSADKYVEVMKHIGKANIEEMLFSILQQRIDFRTLDTAENLEGREIQVLKATMNELLKEVLVASDSANMPVVSDEELEILLAGNDVYKPSGPIPVEIFDDVPSLVEGIVHILKKWPNVNVFYTPVIENFDQIRRKRDHYYDGTFHDQRVILLDQLMPIRPEIIYKQLDGKDAVVVASISSMAGVEKMNPNIYTHQGFRYKNFLSKEPAKVKEFISFMSDLLRDADQKLHG